MRRKTFIKKLAVGMVGTPLAIKAIIERKAGGYRLAQYEGFTIYNKGRVTGSSWSISCLDDNGKWIKMEIPA